MSSAAVTFVLALTLAAQSPVTQTPTPEQIKVVVETLKAGLDSAKPAERLAAVREAARLDVPAVVQSLARGLSDRDADVRLETIEVLGRSQTTVALEALLEHYKDQRKELRKQERALPRLLTAIARHGDARAIGVLTDDVQAQMLVPTLRARILGLARVRSKKSVEALFQLADVIGFVEMHSHTEDFRLALFVLTGVDRGRSLDAWRSWWNGAKEKFAVAEAAPQLSEADAQRWNEFWNASRLGEDERSRK